MSWRGEGINQFSATKSYHLIFITYLQIIQMRPSPFTGKFKKRQIKIQKEKGQQKIQQPFLDVPRENENEANKGVSSRNLFKMPKSNDKGKQREKSKQTKKIYDALKEQQQPKDNEERPSSNFRPNLKLLKNGKKIKLSGHQNPVQVKKQQQSEQSQDYRPILKPPLFKRNEQITSERSNRAQQVIIQQQKVINMEQQSYEGSVNQSISIAPKFKLRDKQNLNTQQLPIVRQQPMQQTGFGTTNFADIKIETRQINLQPSQNKVSQVKVQKQKNRVRQLSKLLNLEGDLYEETLNISCVTSYQIYINKIKSGSLINSNDQAFDQKSSAASQTLTLQFQDFTNQCPQDFNTDVMNIVQKDENQSFNKFILKYAPIFQELIKPSSSVVMPPIFLLALRPQFQKLVTCPFPVFLYHSNLLNIGIIVIGEKLFIAENQIQSILSFGSHLVAGSKDGTIYLWSGKNDKRSRLYRKILEKTQSTNFQLPQYSTRQLDRFSIYRTQNPIISLIYESNDSFLSLDSCCKLTRWKVQKGMNDSTVLQAVVCYQLSNILQRENLIAYNIQKRNESYFISTSSGIIVWNGEQVIQKLDTEGFKVISLALPHRTSFLYAACEDNSIRIYQEHYSNQLFKVKVTGSKVLDIYVPQTQYQNKKLSLTSFIYVICEDNSICSLNLLSSITQLKKILAGAQKKDRNVIYKGVNKLSIGFELVTLFHDLKCISQLKKLDVNIDPSVANIKNIIQENRQVHNWLESMNCITIVS